VTWLGTRGWDLKAWKYRLVHLLDKLPGTCWTELVRWVEYRQLPLSEAFGVARCRRDAAACGGRCYCGKVGRT
jgi:hypothetical protein